MPANFHSASTHSRDGAISPRRLCLWLLLPLLAFRLWFGATLPITGDEAYFIWWGKVPDWGYYDHPPMIGWWLAAQLLVADGPLWLRLSSVLQPFILAAATLWFLPRIWPEADEDRVWWAALFVLLSPAFVWNVLITTDTPLVYFSVFSGLAWLKARRDDSLAWFFLAGLCLAGAVLSKYFVAFLGFAFLVDVVLRPGRRGWVGLFLAYACCIPALALMAWWNAGHCWPNYMFNFVNRHAGAGFGWKNAVLYGVMMVYLLTPVALWRLLGLYVTPARRSLAWLSLVPLILFALLSLVKTVGLHWVLSFLPFAMILLALSLPRERLRGLGRFLVGFACLHVIAIVGISFTAVERWQKMNSYESVVMAIEAREIASRLEPYRNDYVFASNGYADAVAMGYYAERYFLVFGEASSHARHDDILTDFRSLDGKNILILRKSAPGEGEYASYFREAKVETFTLHGVTFYLTLGQGFNYARYRDQVLTTVRDKYYRIPGHLPQTACYFHDRYWPDLPWPPT